MDSRLRKPNFIFECFVELTRPKDGEEVQVTYLFPKDYDWDDDLKKQLPKFSFPSVRSESEELQHFTFVLTDLDSKYRFGFCRYPPKLDSCTCFVSDMPWYKVFYRALDKISDLRLDHQNEVIEPFLGGLRSHSFPSLGTETLSVVPVGVDTGQVYSFPLPIPNKLPEIPADHNLTLFYTNLHYNVVLHLFANMIFERRIIITSSSLSLLSACVQGAVMILYPLHWQHIFIPITPPHLIDYCAAPMPFLMGIHSSLMDRVHQMPMDDVVILDVDESTIESPYCEDLLSLPGEVITNLKHILKKQSSAYGATVARAFMLAQVSMIGGYRSALKLRQGEKEVTFDEDAFLKSRPNMEEFLGQLLHFQHFRQFINGRIEKLKGRSIERDLFDNEVLAYEEELKGSAQEQVKLAFQKFAASTVEGSKKLGDKLTKQAKQNYKILDKNFKSMMKETRRQLQGMKSDQKTEYRGHTIENSALVAGQLPEHKASTLPDSRKLSNMQSATSSLPASADPLKSRKPPPVIPYQRHLEGKRKLAESLRQSGIIPDASDRDRANSLSQVPVGILLNLTPPDTPRSATSADQSSLDHSERASLDSKGSTEASIASGEVATANLVDLSTSDGNPTERAKAGEMNGQDSDTESASTISTYSSSDEEGNGQSNWEQFEEKPPLPPPRSELRHLFSSQSNSGPTPVDTPLETPLSSTNPFSSETVTQTNPNPFQSSDVVVKDSPLDDFSTSIAQALFDTSKRRSDPFAATALATMSRDIYKTIGEESLPDPLIPTSSSGNMSRHTSTALPRSSPHVIADRRFSENILGGICTQPNSSGSTPNLSVVHPSNSAPTSTSAGNSPVMSQKLATAAAGTTRNFHNVPTSATMAAAITDAAPNTDIKLIPSPKKLPPPKPQPYSGGAVTFYRERQQRPHQDLQTVSSNGGKTVNNHAYDPFGEIFGDGGMHAYASVRGNSTATNCAQSKESPLV